MVRDLQILKIIRPYCIYITGYLYTLLSSLNHYLSFLLQGHIIIYPDTASQTEITNHIQKHRFVVGPRQVMLKIKNIRFLSSISRSTKYDQ